MARDTISFMPFIGSVSTQRLRLAPDGQVIPESGPSTVLLSKHSWSVCTHVSVSCTR